MSALDLGRRPELLRLRLIPAAGFYLEMEAIAPDELVEPIVLNFVGVDIQWEATIDSTTLVHWDISAEEVDLLIDESPGRVTQLLYGGLLWALGKFEVEGD